MTFSEHEEPWAVPASASTAIAALISGPARPAQVIADFPVATYLRVGEAVIALVTPDAVRLPNALVCRPPHMILCDLWRHTPQIAQDHGAPTTSDTQALVGDGCVRIGHARVSVGRWWDPVPRLPVVDDPAALGRAVDAMRLLLPAWPDSGEPAAKHLVAGREVLASALTGDGTLAAAADQLVGLGPGLTPAGDDLLAGAVAGLVLFGRALGGHGAWVDRADALDRAKQLAVAVDERAARTTVLAADLARHAATGAVAEPVATVCRALAGRGPLEPALGRLLAIGHTSGRDLAEGLLLGAAAALDTW